MILSEGCWILLVDRELLIVEGARDAVRPRIENGNGRERRRRNAGIHGGHAALIIAPEKTYAQIQRARRPDLRADIEFVGIGTRKRRRDGGVRTAEPQQESAQLAGLNDSIAIAIDPLICASAQTIGIP